VPSARRHSVRVFIGWRIWSIYVEVSWLSQGTCGILLFYYLSWAFPALPLLSFSSQLFHSLKRQILEWQSSSQEGSRGYLVTLHALWEKGQLYILLCLKPICGCLWKSVWLVKVLLSCLLECHYYSPFLLTVCVCVCVCDVFELSVQVLCTKATNVSTTYFNIRWKWQIPQENQNDLVGLQRGTRSRPDKSGSITGRGKILKYITVQSSFVLF
jgi:hypothetical protein